ncbi:hypothetical protein BGZ97_008311, partial [Linnemannia gamsii]
NTMFRLKMYDLKAAKWDKIKDYPIRQAVRQLNIDEYEVHVRVEIEATSDGGFRVQLSNLSFEVLDLSLEFLSEGDQEVLLTFNAGPISHQMSVNQDYPSELMEDLIEQLKSTNLH